MAISDGNRFAALVGKGSERAIGLLESGAVDRNVLVKILEKHELMDKLRKIEGKDDTR